jgi:zinc-binding alcohol dehydrogenase/oxidoreductase
MLTSPEHRPSNPALAQLLTLDLFGDQALLHAAAHAQSTNTPWPAKALELLAHNYSAKSIWAARIRIEPAKFPRFISAPTLEELNNLSIQSEIDIAYIVKVASTTPQVTVTYKNSTNAEFETTYFDIALQLLTHGLYHRGQINMLLRQAQLEPILVSYLDYSRLNNNINTLADPSNSDSIPATMQAIIIGEKLAVPTVSTLPVPIPGQGELLIRIEAAALNRRDYWIQQGKYAALQYPVVPGSDISGTVVATGPRTIGNLLGARVLVNPAFDHEASFDASNTSRPPLTILGMPRQGSLAQYIAIPEANVYTIPTHLDFYAAAALPLAGLTAWSALQKSSKEHNSLANKTVLITGIGGGVALFAFQFALAQHARVFVTSSSDQKIDKAMSLGASGGANYNDPAFLDTLKAQAGSFDVIIDGAAGPGLTDLLKLCAPRAKVVIYGGTQGSVPAISPQLIFWKELQIMGSTMGSSAEFEQMLTFVEEHKIIPVFEPPIPLTKASEAFQLLEGNHFGKIVVDVNH